MFGQKYGEKLEVVALLHAFLELLISQNTHLSKVSVLFTVSWSSFFFFSAKSFCPAFSGVWVRNRWDGRFGMIMSSFSTV